jgi:NADH-quinone oxidoreductase E subunit
VSTLYDEIQQMRGVYPDPRSAIMPALRAAQEKYGWLSPDALREVADALEVSPAYCKAIASFYDMYHLEPVGRNTVEVCTNLACALVGAQGVVQALSDELGIAPGETTEDDGITFRTIECAGGCGYAPVVVVDGRYREPVRPEDVAALVEELRAEA